MFLKKSPNHIPMFDNIVFKIFNLLLSVYNIHTNFKIIIPLHLTYVKNNSKDLLRLNFFLLKTFSMNWVRVSFRGKGFRLRKFKNLNKLTFNFGHSHWTKMALTSTNFFFKKIRRQNYLCLIKTYSQLKAFKKVIKFLKKLNVYTKRGLRLRKQYIRRRFGKISQVVSLLH